MSAREPIAVQTLGDVVYARLREEIISLKLAPGQPLVEEHVARDLGVSKTPVRAALARLGREGFVVSEPHRGSFVAPISYQSMREQFQVKVAIEGYALRSVVPNFSPDDVNASRAILDESRRALESRDYSRWIESNNAFHRYFVAKMANTTMLDIIDNLYAHLQRTRMVFFTTHGQGDWERMHAYHERILEAVVRGEVSMAQDLLYEHTERFLEGLGGQGDASLGSASAANRI